MPTSRYERAARSAGYRTIAGLDEAGRGALFGPVFAAAVVLNPARPVRGLDDSKQLDPERRRTLAARIRERATAWALGAADAFEIDRINILEASRLAMLRALANLNQRLSVPCDYLLVDAVRLKVDVPQKPLIHGDSLCFSIAAASILAKVARDAAMSRWDTVFPEYGFARNQGYGTPDHLAALERLGPAWLHRFSFAPVRAASRLAVWDGYPVTAELQSQFNFEEELSSCR
jgi:ribonuclease HII